MIFTTKSVTAMNGEWVWEDEEKNWGYSTSFPPKTETNALTTTFPKHMTCPQLRKRKGENLMLMGD